MNFPGAAAVVGSVAAFGFTHGHVAHKSFATRAVVLSILGLLSIPALLSALYYFHVVPEWAWFYTLRSWTGAEFLVIFLGAAGGAFAAMLARWLLLMPLLFVLALAVVPYLKPWVNPLNTNSFQERWQGDVCLQSTESTCGPASTATLLKRLGVTASEREIAKAAFTTGSGTEAWYLARYCRSRGLRTHFDFRPGFSSTVGFPAMVGVRVSGFGHFIAVLEVRGDQVTYADPLSGEFRVPMAEFLRRYSFTGFHMVVSKP